MNWIIAAFAVFIMLAGGGVVVGTYYSTTVVLPEDVQLPLSTTVYYKDGKNVIATLGEENRQFVTSQQIPLFVQHEVASAEDRKFYEHSGVDYAGIARAAWNNFTGGSKQGASTITQQYARNAYANLKSDTYGRKVKEAILASKLSDKYSKDEVMQHYLNTIYFGRGAYGIEAAAKAYFGVSASKLNVAQGAVLAGVIKQPVPDPNTGHKGFDPANNPTDAKDRWNYVLDGMILKKWLDPKDRPTQYPKTLPVKNGDAMTGVKTPVGNVVNYVKQEMAGKGICGGDGKPTCSDALRDGGYKITTTIDKRTQDAAVAVARRASKGSELEGYKPNIMAAVVSVEPSTGRVLAYYGGDDGTGTDYAGMNTESNGQVSGGHPPGSSFKVYTLAAAVANGISTQSHWDPSDYKTNGFTVRNGTAGASTSCGKYCTLEYSTLKSYNVPFYKVAEKIGADKVVDMARAAGITTMWSVDNKGASHLVDLTKNPGKEVASSASGCQNSANTGCPIYYTVGYGQYPITVLDHANGLATMANRGKYNKAHFIYSIEKQNQDTGAWEKVDGEQLKPRQTIAPEVTDEVTEVLKKYGGQSNVNHDLADGRPVAEKTGTWELNETSDHNAHSWMVGYTPQLATAVWVGNVGSKQQALLNKNGSDMYGANLPGDIFERYMNLALKGKDIVGFHDGPSPHLGDPNAGDGVAPVVQPPPPTFPDPNNPGPNNPDPNNPGPNNPLFPGNGNGNGGGGGARPGG